jgi:hypothetical protein
MAIMAAQASACFDPSYCFICVAWHLAQVAGAGSLALDASVAFWCSDPWQASQPTDAAACRESLQSETIPGVLLAWQAMHFAVTSGTGAGTAAGAAARREASATTAGMAAGIVSVVSSGVGTR